MWLPLLLAIHEFPLKSCYGLPKVRMVAEAQATVNLRYSFALIFCKHNENSVILLRKTQLVAAMALLFAGYTLAQTHKPDAPRLATEVDLQFVKKPQPAPDYDQAVLIPLREAQREAAEKARLAALEAARIAKQREDEQRAVQTAKVAQTASQRVENVSAPPPGSRTDWMAAAGIAPENWGYADYIITHESGWRWWITNNEGSGATGLGQALPASKMAPYGADYLTNPITQLKWAQAYAVQRYGSWANAYAYWLTHRVW